MKSTSPPLIFTLLILIISLFTATTSLNLYMPHTIYRPPYIPPTINYSHYAAHCHDIIPQTSLINSSKRDNDLLSLSRHLSFVAGFYINPNSKVPSSFIFPKSVSFKPNTIRRTENSNVYAITIGKFEFDGGRWGVYSESGVFKNLLGFWSESTKKLCVVGEGYYFQRIGRTVLHEIKKDLKVVMRISYLNKSDVFNSLVTWDLESIDEKNSSKYFNPVSFLGVSRAEGHVSEYKYALIEGESESESESVEGFLSSVDLPSVYELEYDSDCTNHSCNILGEGFDYLPKLMWIETNRFKGNKIRQMLIGFPNYTNPRSHYSRNFPFHPNSTLIAEGAWDDSTNEIRATACRIMNSEGSMKNSAVGDCSIQLSFGFPGPLTYENRNLVQGKIWSNRSVNDSGYFATFRFKKSTR